MGRVWGGHGEGMGRVWGGHGRGGYGEGKGRVWGGYGEGVGRVWGTCATPQLQPQVDAVMCAPSLISAVSLMTLG